MPKTINMVKRGGGRVGQSIGHRVEAIDIFAKWSRNCFLNICVYTNIPGVLSSLVRGDTLR